MRVRVNVSVSVRVSVSVSVRVSVSIEGGMNDDSDNTHLSTLAHLRAK